MNEKAIDEILDMLDYKKGQIEGQIQIIKAISKKDTAAVQLSICSHHNTIFNCSSILKIEYNCESHLATFAGFDHMHTHKMDEINCNKQRNILTQLGVPVVQKK